MIGRIRGVLLDKQPPQLLVDVQGVAYEIEASTSTIFQLPATGEEVILHTHLVVREDAQLLYGFYTLSERGLFRLLIRINGVGPKLAITILSGISADEFSRCIMESDTKALTQLPGVGKKTAERLVVELRDKLGDEFRSTIPGQMPAGLLQTESNPVSDAVSALIALGYKPQDASRMVRSVESEDMQTEEIIKAALQSMAKA